MRGEKVGLWEGELVFYEIALFFLALIFLLSPSSLLLNYFVIGETFFG